VTLLFRTFVTQFFTSETVTSDAQLRQSIAGIIAFVLTPGILLLLQVFPDYQMTVIRVHAHRAPAGLIDDRLEWIVQMLSVYSMMTIGLIAAMSWDALTFDRRDAMVLGPLPVSGRTIVLAKLSALAALVLGTSAAINAINGFLFAVETSDLLGARAFLLHLIGFAAATIGGAVMLFSTVVAIRNTLAVVAPARVTAIAGSLFQCVFVVALLCAVAWTPLVGPAARRSGWGLSRAMTDALPWSWFVGLFETIRASPRRDWPEFVMLSRRATIGLALSVSAAVVTSVAAFRTQMRAALTPVARPGPLGQARALRALARGLTLGDRRAAVVADFVVTTIARNRAQQSYIAMNVAVGVAWALIALSNARGGPLTALASTPFILGFWLTVGLRASFFAPGELPAAWAFRVVTFDRDTSLLAGVRAASFALVAPPIAALAFFAGGASLALVGVLVAAILASSLVLTVDFVPFTRAYEPGHAKLKTRWPLYLVGTSLVGYGLPRLPVWLLITIAAVLHIASRVTAHRWTVEPVDEEPDDASSVTRLDLASARGV